MSQPHKHQLHSPYPGLRPFEPYEDYLFFGRAQQVEEMLMRLENNFFLAVVGNSGCGKSSLVRAGLLPALEDGFLSEAGPKWRIAIMRPGDEPFLRLREALLHEQALAPERGSSPKSAAFLEAVLRRGPRGLTEVVNECQLPQGTNLLILVDQFEEIFRYRSQVGAADDADAFIKLLLETAQESPDRVGFPSHVRIYVVITMRSDFIGECDIFRGLPEAINNSQFLTPRMTSRQYQDAIVEPARVFGGSIEDTLVDRILSEYLLNEHKGEHDQLPVLQHALMRMWTQKEAEEEGGKILTLKDYNRIEGLEKALSNHATEVYDQLAEKDKLVAEILFRILTEPEKGRRDTRRPTDLETVVNIVSARNSDDSAREQVERVVAAFRRPDRSFLTPPNGVTLEDATVLDISHECLIRQWDKLREWVKEEAYSVDTYRELLPPARRWNERKHRWWSAFSGLWRGLDLRRAKEWRQRVSAEWSSLYGGDFPSVDRFIRASNVAAGLKTTTLVIAIVLAMLGYTVYQKKQARAAEEKLELQRRLTAIADQERDRANIEAEAAKAAKNEAVEATNQTKLALTRVKEEKKRVEKAREIAKREKKKAERQAIIAKQETIRAKQAKSEADALRALATQRAGDAELQRVRLLSGQSDALVESAYAELRDASGNLRKNPEVSRQLALLATKDPIRFQESKLLEVILHRTVKSFRKPHKFSGHKGKVYDVTFSPDGRLLASVDKTMLKLWDISTLENLHSIKAHEKQIQSVAFKADGAIVATSSADETIKLWDVNSGIGIQNLSQHSGIGKKIAYNQTSDYFAVASNGAKSKAGFLEVWNSNSGKRIAIRTLDNMERAKEYGAYSVGFTIDGKQLAIAGALGHVYFFDLLGNEVKSSKMLEPTFGKVIYDLAFSQDGKYLALGMKEGGIKIWNLEEKRSEYNLEGHKGAVYGVAFSSDGEWLASAGSDETVRVWGVSPVPLTGNRELFILNDFSGNVYDVEFGHDRKLLAAVGEHGDFYLYDLSKENLVSLAKNNISGELEKQDCEKYVDIRTCSSLYQDES